MKIDTKSAEFQTAIERLVSRTVVFCKINNTWSTEETVQGAMDTLTNWFIAEMDILKMTDNPWWKKMLDKCTFK